MEDWLQDPLRERIPGRFEWHRFSSLDKLAQENWEAQHGSTRLKLEGAAYHYRMVKGSSSLAPPFDEVDMYRRLLRWHLDSFFFELVSSFDSMLQEVNWRYGLQIPEDRVSWSNKPKENKFHNRIPADLFQLIHEGWGAGWFVKVRSYRNAATHQFLIPTVASWTGFFPEDGPVTGIELYEVGMWAWNKEGKLEEEPIEKCENYLQSMAQLIAKAWGKFELEPIGEEMEK